MMMMRAGLIAAFAALGLGGAAAEPAAPPGASDSLCVPRALLERMAVYLAAQPWQDVAPIMAGIQDLGRAPRACPPGRPQPAPPGAAPSEPVPSEAVPRAGK